MIIIKRKIVTAILSSLLFALIFSVAGGFEANRFFNLFSNLYYLNLLIVIIYGVLASCLSDWISRKVAKGGTAPEIISFLLHCCFGAVFQVFGLVSAILFFIIDRLLRRGRVGWLPVIISLSAVLLAYLILINN